MIIENGFNWNNQLLNCFRMSKLIHSKPKFIILPSQPKYLIKKATKTNHKLNYDPAYKKSNTMCCESVKQFNKSAYKCLESIKVQLNQVMQQVVNEQTRNQILNDIIVLLREDVEKVEKQEMIEQKVTNIENTKMARKIEYDMDQILQKHNEEIFKINNLNIQVAAARSERLVFSNLFKKIESQIKTLENHYNLLIIKNQKYKQTYNKIADNKSSDQSFIQTPSSTPHGEMTAQQTQYTIYQTKHTSLPCIKQPIFLTASKIPKLSTKAIVSFLANENGRQKQRNKTVCFQQNIKLVQHKIQHILNKIGLTNIEESIRHYQALSEDNCRLINEIEEQNNAIFEAEHEINRINFELRHNNIYEGRQLFNLQRLPNQRRTRTKITLDDEDDDFYSDDYAIMSDIKHLLGLDKDEQSQCLSKDEILMTIDAKIQSLIDIGANKDHTKRREPSQQIRRRIMLTQCAQSLFSKMQRYELCDKILSKEQFIKEYNNERSRNRKTIKAKRLNV